MAKNSKTEIAAEADTETNSTRASASDTPPHTPFRAGSKLALLVQALERAEGATLAEMQAATGWQGHSVRGAMAGSLKKQGLQVTNEKTEDRGRVWRLVAQKL
ncbi:DUF3489 domain-containing protein [Neogemmobacter tilapiae]|uniref:DUF3489 domain-containing protein n=1 Tax=Neogemmobacter tilapiae TaxID=875041 RepID=A0A918WQE9_9RHOB|nr:DUF3489 domain-containing protein [Gemmobacter tilapiae]GHC67676.1 hypothetical protein GCM10007315_35840 [Gemmobacter tilapiae]